MGQTETSTASTGGVSGELQAPVPALVATQDLLVSAAKALLPAKLLPLPRTTEAMAITTALTEAVPLAPRVPAPVTVLQASQVPTVRSVQQATAEVTAVLPVPA